MSKKSTTRFVQAWPSSHAPKHMHESEISHVRHDESLDLIPTNELRQGELYILKIKLVAVALFQGWYDDMCCFYILRTDLLEELRWSEAKYLPENFDAYPAFDYAGNPPVQLWTTQLRAVIPINWFSIFEEARHMQRQWNTSYGSTISNSDQLHTLADSDENQHCEDNSDPSFSHEETEKEYSSATKTIPNKDDEYMIPSTPPKDLDPKFSNITSNMRLQQQASLVTQEEPQIENLSTQDTKQRRSLNLFFMKKKKTKDPLSNSQEEGKRKSNPLTSITSITLVKHSHSKDEEVVSEEEKNSEASTKSDSSIKLASSSTTPAVKTPKSVSFSDKKPGLFGLDNYFDFQTTFSFLNEHTAADSFTLMETNDNTISSK